MRRKLYKILITGGAGFIGANFIHYILRKYPEYKIINLDKLTYAGNLDNLKHVKNCLSYKFIKGDICDRSLLDKIMKDCNLVINFAAQTHVDKSILSCDGFLKTNVYGLGQLLNVALKYNIQKFIQISTDEVYGSLESGYSKETDPLRPTNPYSASKASADLLALSYFKTYGLPVVITRSCNNFGPYQYPEKITPLFITNALENKSLPIYGDGLNIREWIFVEDNCRAIDLIMHKAGAGDIYNISGNMKRTNKELAKFILKSMHKPQSLIRFVEDRPGHDKRYALNNSRLCKLGWKYQYTFDQGLSKTMQWYCRNTDWWEKLKHKKGFKSYYKNWYGNRIGE